MSEAIRVQVLWGFPTHKCSACGRKGEWGGDEPPTEAQLAKCPACGSGPLCVLPPKERTYKTKTD